MEERKKIIVIEDDKEIVSILNGTGKIEGHPVKAIFYEENIGNTLKEILAENPKLCLCDGLGGDFLELYEKLIQIDPYYKDKFRLVSSDGNLRKKSESRNIVAYEKGTKVFESYKTAVKDLEN